MRHALTVFFLVLLCACSKPPREEASAPSPLLSGDGDRLWILARASKVGNGRECKDLYLTPDDPRYQGQAQKCDSWSRHYADYLSINGFPTIDYLHLQDPDYWSWYEAKRELIKTCKSLHQSPPVGTPREQRDNIRALRNACDPYDHALKNENRTSADLGVRFN